MDKFLGGAISPNFQDLIAPTPLSGSEETPRNPIVLMFTCWGDQIVWHHELARGCKHASVSDLAVSVDTHVSLVTLVIWLEGEI